MTSVLNQHVLVLNRQFVPINISTVYDALCAVFSERAKFIDPETYMVYDWESWVETWNDAANLARVSARQVVNCPNVRVVVPEVITCTEYKGVGYGTNYRGRPKFSRRNIFLRDKNTCMYCGKKFDSKLLNIDHVVPKSQGGHSDWTNVVLSCIKCNDRKRNRTPVEAGMKLVRHPRVPTADEVRRPLHERLLRKFSGRTPKSWEMFMGKVISDAYWNVELR